MMKYCFFELLGFLGELLILFLEGNDGLDKGLFVRRLRVVGGMKGEEVMRRLDMGDVWGLNHLIK